MEKFKKYIPALILTIVILICVSILVGAIIEYRGKFGTEYSDSKTEWGAFGDFLNPFIGIVNILLLVYISFEVSRLDGQREMRALNIQRRITICQMSNEKVNELTKVFDSMPMDPPINNHQLLNVEKTFNFFLKYSDHLFSEFFFHHMFFIGIMRDTIKGINQTYINIELTKEKYTELRTDDKYFQARTKEIKQKYQTNKQEAINEIRTVHSELNENEEAELTILQDRKNELYGLFQSQKESLIAELNRFILIELDRTK